MKAERSPIFHDRQVLQVPNLPDTTTSTSFVDIDEALIITKDLGIGGTYIAWVSMSVDQSNNNSMVVFRALVNGNPTDEREVPFGPASAGNPQSVMMQGFGVGVVKDSEVQIQWKTDTGTATLLSMSIIIDGVPDNRVVG